MVPCTIGQAIDSKPQSDMCSPETGGIVEYELMNHKAKACLLYGKVTQGAGIHFYENNRPNQGKNLKKKSRRNYGFHMFFLKVLTPTHTETSL